MCRSCKPQSPSPELINPYFSYCLPGEEGWHERGSPALSHCPRQVYSNEPLPHPATLSPLLPLSSCLLLLTHPPLLPSPTPAGQVLLEAPSSSSACQTMLDACSPAPTGLGALNSHQQHPLDKLGEVVGEEECSGTCFGGGEKRDKGAEGESGGWWQARLPSRLGDVEGGAWRAPQCCWL